MTSSHSSAWTDNHRPPASSVTRIGVAIVQHQDCYLVGVREPGIVLAGQHEFPGGKCFPEESAEKCAVRECLEETGIQVKVLELLNQVCHTYSHGTVDLSFFLCTPVDASPEVPLGNFVWVPISEFPRLNFPEGNRQVLKLLLARAGSADE